MDEEEWPDDPDAVVVSDEPTEGLVPAAADEPPSAAAVRADVAAAATVPTRTQPMRTRPGSLVPVVVILLISTVFGKTLVDQRDEARDVARVANDRVESVNEELATLRDQISTAIDDRDDPFGNVFVDRSDDIRADALADILGGERQELKACVASQLTDAIAGDMPQVPLDDFDAQYAATVQWVEKVRGLDFESVPTPRRVTQSELGKLIGTPAPPANHAIDTEVLAALGAIPSDADLAALTNAALRHAIVGRYVPGDNELVIAVANPDAPLQPLELVALAHELQHALAVQQLGMPPAISTPGTDQGLAATALVEGDATLTMTRYQVGALDPVVLIGALDGGTMSSTEERFGGAPHVVGASLLFPYRDGLAFTCDLEREGGNAMIDAAYAAAPATTAQVMWPKRFRDRETAVDIRDMPHPGERWVEVGRSHIGAALVRALFEAPGDDLAAALDDPYGRASAWAGSEGVVWERGDDTAIGLAFAEHGQASGPSLCSSFQTWYPRAFPSDKVKDATDGLVAIGDGRVAVIRCANNTVRIGIGPDALTAAAITR